MNLPFTELDHVAVIDCETTGLDPENDRIVSIAVVMADLRLTNQNTKDLHITLDPEIPIPSDATKIHGIRDEDVVGKEKFSDVAKKIIDFIGDRPLVGFNVQFDKRFLNAELKRNGFKTFSRKKSYCVADYLREAWGYGSSLDHAKKQMALLMGESSTAFHFKGHNALNDATDTMIMAVLIKNVPFDRICQIAGEPNPTKKQLDYIRDLGGDPDIVKNRKEASDEIDRLRGANRSVSMEIELDSDLVDRVVRVSEAAGHGVSVETESNMSFVSGFVVVAGVVILSIVLVVICS